MIPKLSKKGFLFTLSAVLFATTLIIFSQTFLSINYDNEKAIINASAVASLANINDSISYNMWKITGLGLDVNVADDLNIHLRERIPKQYSVSDKITEFESMLNNQYFKRIAGWHELDASDLKYGKTEIFVGSIATIESDYDNNTTLIYSKDAGSIKSIDINVFVDGPRDSETISVDAPSPGSAQISINYIDTNTDLGGFIQTYSDIDTGLEHSFNFDFPNGENIEILVGSIGPLTESFRITNNTSFDAYYDVRINYSEGANYLPVRLNSILRQTLGNADTNTMLKIIN